jgi:hypothetical protein
MPNHVWLSVHSFKAMPLSHMVPMTKGNLRKQESPQMRCEGSCGVISPQSTAGSKAATLAIAGLAFLLSPLTPRCTSFPNN